MAFKRTTYTRPSTPYQTPPSCLPLVPYKSLSHPPPQTPVQLPIRPALPPPPPGWITTSHVFSTGSLTRDSRPFAMQGEGTGRDDRNARAVAEARQLVFPRWDAEEMALPTIADDQTVQKGLWMAAERWRRQGARDREGGLTLVIMHGSAFTKEVLTFHQGRLWRMLNPICVRHTAGDRPSTT